MKRLVLLVLLVLPLQVSAEIFSVDRRRRYGAFHRRSGERAQKISSRGDTSGER